MAQNFGSDSTQGTILLTFGTQAAGSTITITDGSKALLSWRCDKTFDSVVISCPEIVPGGAYTVTAGTSSTEVTMDTLIYGSSGINNPGKGGGTGGRPDRTQDPAADSKAPPQGMQAPGEHSGQTPPDGGETPENDRLQPPQSGAAAPAV